MSYPDSVGESGRAVSPDVTGIRSSFDDPSVGTPGRIAGVHHASGVAALLPALITDTPDRTRGAIAAATEAVCEGIPGIAGLDPEGFHISVAKKSAHDPSQSGQWTRTTL